MAERTAEFRVKMFGTDQYYPCTLKLEDEVYVDLIEHGAHIIYGLVDPRNDGLFYVGQTRQFFTRMRAHCIVFPYSRRPDPLAQRKYAIHVAGLAVLIRVFDVAFSEEEALTIEYRLIQQHRRVLLNIQTSRWIHHER